MEIQKLKWYQQEAKRTCPSLGNDKLDLAHMVLGMFSEFEEYINAIEKGDKINVSEESADAMWYMANYCTFRGYGLKEIFSQRMFNGKSYPLNLSTLQDYIKKYIVYNKPINVEKEKDLLSRLCYNLDHMFANGAVGYEIALDRNIAKLKARFPEKFTEEAALNRNLEKERQILEGNAE